MHTLALVATLLAVSLAQEYALQSSFAGGPTFLDNFGFWTSWDPTYGYVHYVDRPTAEQYHMINITDSTIAWGVDTTQVLDPNANLGRLSLRLTSLQSWTHGLFILDLAHMPTPICGTWPSFWTLGGTGVWPGSGEIDIIEFVNDGPHNLIALHTTPGCTIAGADQTGTLLTNNCGAGNGITGCTVAATAEHFTADSFNAAGGGVYAMEWTSNFIRIWTFPRYAIPDSITSGAPDVNTFGQPIANFQGSCDIDAHFYNHSLVFNIDFCGQWAGPTFESGGCPELGPDNAWQSCNNFVALNPAAFYDTYWEINYLEVYQSVPGTSPTSSTSLSSIAPAVSTSSVSTALSNAQGRSSTPTVSIAGTTANVTTGSFIATSSMLSVLSSLSASFASVVSPTSAISIESLSSTGSPVIDTGSSVISATSPTTPVVPSSKSSATSLSTSGTAPALSPDSIESSTSSCTEAICTSYVSVIVVETVTVNTKIQSAQLAQQTDDPCITQSDSLQQHVRRAHHGRSAIPSPRLSSTASDNSDKLGQCKFLIPGGVDLDFRWTEFICTFTKYAVFDGEIATVGFTSTTHLLPNNPLVMSTFLEIDRFVAETGAVDDVAFSTDDILTGQFTVTSTYTTVTRITAYPFTRPFSTAMPSVAPTLGRAFQTPARAFEHGAPADRATNVAVAARQAHVELTDWAPKIPVATLPDQTQTLKGRTMPSPRSHKHVHIPT